MYLFEYNRIEEDYSVLNAHNILIGYIDPRQKIFISKAGWHRLSEMETILNFMKNLPESK